MAIESFIRLGEVCTKIGSGATPRGGKESYKGGETALIRSQNIYNEGFFKDGLAFIDENQAADLKNVEVRPNDVLLNITGDSVARCCQVPEHILPARVNQHVAIIRTDPKSLDSRYLRYVLVSHQFQVRLLALASAGATRPALTKQMIENLEIPFPDLSIQKRIGQILGELDDKIELNRRMNATLEAMARALFQSWFVDFDPVRAKLDGRKPAGMDDETAALFPSEFQDSELGPIPKGWKIGSLDELLVLQRGFDLPANDRISGPYPVISAGGQHGFHNQFMVKGPGVTTGRSGVLGKVFFIHEDFWPLNTSLWVKDFKVGTPAYAFFILQGLDVAGFNAGSAVPTLNRNHLHSLPMIIPSKSVIDAFDFQVMALLNKKNANERESEKLSSLRDLLLPKLLSGEISVSSEEGKRAVNA